MNLDEFESALSSLVASGGPTEEQYEEVVRFIESAAQAVGRGQLLREDIRKALNSYGDVFSVATLQGRALQKPHGYAGDFEMMDCIYLQHVSPDTRLANWDKYFQANHAPKAVRNRKSYFHAALDSLPKDRCTVLKLGIGPGRSMHEWLTRNPSADIHIECVDVDPNAIKYAQTLNASDSHRIKYHASNVFKFAPPPESRYNLIWAAGLFDYFDDDTFVRIASRFVSRLTIGGEMIIGNFSDTNPSRSYMELFGEWFLHHRSTEQLLALGKVISQNQATVRIGSEPEGVNLFLHICRRE